MISPPHTPLRVVLISQEDSLVIPQNIQRILEMPEVQVAAAVVADTDGSLVNRKSDFAKGFGLSQAAQMAAVILFAHAADFCDRLSGWRLLKQKRSIRAAARANRTLFRTVRDVHAPEFLEFLRQLNPDLILSFSAPCIFKPELLRLPRLGCINLHCSALPRYAGLMPSFWALYHDENETGVTVHCMDDRIDNGAILDQERVTISPGMSVFELIQRTKCVGGKVACKVLRQFSHGTVRTRPNHVSDRSYYSWPTIDEMRRFRARGGRLI